MVPTAIIDRYRYFYGFTNAGVLRGASKELGRTWWYGPTSGLPGITDAASRAWWDAYALWPGGTNGAPEDGIAKPSWERAVQLWRAHAASYLTSLDYPTRRADEVLKRRAAQPFASPRHSERPLLIGEGPDRFTGIAHALTESTLAGAHYRPIVMRDDEHGLTHFWTIEGAGSFMGELIEHRELTESAHGILLSRYAADAKALEGFDPDTATEAQGLAHDALREKLVARMARAETELAEIIAQISDPDYLPKDLPTLREVYVQRIEAAAMRRVKEIKGARTQQGVDTPATCLDMARALEEVSSESALGVQELGEAADAGAAKTAFDAALAKIAAVTPLNVPEWKVKQTTASGHAIAVLASHPEDAEIAGRVLLESWKATDGAGAAIALTPSITRPGNGPSVQWEAALPAGTVYPVALSFGARNLCGPSRFAADIADPAP